MIGERTWHRDENSRTNFSWCATLDGVQLEHSNENAPYIIPWDIFQAVHQKARSLAESNGGFVLAGTSQNLPTAGSVGEWVLQQKLSTKTGYLTPRHLSFIGPILGRMKFIVREVNGNSIVWKFF